MLNSAEFSSKVDEILLTEYDGWARNISCSAPRPFVAVAAQRKTGKTRLFRLLMKEQPHTEPTEDCPGVHWVHWDLLRDTRVRTFDGFWTALGDFAKDTSLFTHVNKESTTSQSPEMKDSLNLWGTAIGDGQRKVILVLDHWAEARHGGGEPRVDLDAVLLLNQALNTFADNAQPGDTEIGVVIPTGFPSAQLLVQWARSLEDKSPGLWRLSGDIERQYQTEYMPLLTETLAREVCEAFGATSKCAGAAVNFAGGWLGPLRSMMLDMGQRHQSSLDDAARATAVNQILPIMHLIADLLADQSPTLPANMNDSERRAFTLGKAIADAEENDKSAMRLVIPSNSHENYVPAPAVMALIHIPRFLVVDTENIALRFRDSGERTDAFAPLLKELDVYGRIMKIAEKCEVPGGQVILAARSEGRLKQLFGPRPKECAEWQVRYPIPTRKNQSDPRNVRQPDNSDDTAAAISVAEQASLHPKSTFFILSGDKDHISNLAHRYPAAHFTLLAPYNIGEKVPEFIETRSNCSWEQEVLVNTETDKSPGPFPDNYESLKEKVTQSAGTSR